MLRRRRCAHNEDESDLSEGFESDEEEEEELQRADGPGVPANASLGKEGRRDAAGEQGVWESGSEEEEEEEEGGTAFDVETDSDMNSQESRSDLEDMEDAGSPVQEQQHAEEEEEEKTDPSRDEGSTPPATNGPLLSSDPSISSNLQAMSSQLFQAKRCFRLAPTFSNVLLRPSHASNAASEPAPPQEATPTPGDTPSHTSPEIANGTNDDGHPLSVCLFICYCLFDLLASAERRLLLCFFFSPPQTPTRRTASTATSRITARKHFQRNWRF